MRRLLSVLLIFASTAVSAHPGHVADLAGHNHWVAGAAIGAAVIIGVWGALKGKRKTDTETEELAEENA